MPRQLIHSSDILEYHLDTHDGVEMISRFPLFRQVISGELSQDQAQLLAEPIKNAGHNRVSWYSSLSGPVVPFEELEEKDQRHARDVISERRQELSALAGRFSKSPARSRKLAGELLARLLNRPENFKIFLVGGRPVVAGWGLSPLKSEMTGALTGEPQEHPRTEPPPLPEKEAAAAVRKKYSLRKRLLGLFLGLLLLSALIFLLFPGLIRHLERLFSVPVHAPAAAGRNAGERGLVIPEGAEEKNDFSFMEGCWESRADGLVNIETELPVVVKYCFDRSGRASVTVDEKDAGGRHVQTCASAAAASFDDGSVVIADSGGPVCPAGRSYGQSVLICSPRTAGGRAGVNCSIKQTDMDLIQSVFLRADE
ncbi:MAG: hypothetical protein LBP22_16545 [Deltaproteobacteria bacterium]|jgi:hypothetical protein|nr:hypothetical protein [Deltaproteobacteria bacterium]